MIPLTLTVSSRDAVSGAVQGGARTVTLGMPAPHGKAGGSAGAGVGRVRGEG